MNIPFQNKNSILSIKTLSMVAEGNKYYAECSGAIF